MPQFRRKNLRVTVDDSTQYATVYETIDNEPVIVGTLIRRRVLSPAGTPAWSIANTDGEVLGASNYIFQCLWLLEKDLKA